MSTPTVAMARARFSNTAFARLSARLKFTGARYDQIAIQFRGRIRFTHHAKRRAYRAGLRIDTKKARACPQRAISMVPAPVLIKSAAIPSSADTLVNAPAATEAKIIPEAHAAGQEDAYMRDLSLPPLRNLPEVVVRKHRRDGRPRVVLRLPPLNLALNMQYPPDPPFDGPVPSAPRLMPKQLPEDESGMEDIMLESASSFLDCAESLLTPPDVPSYSGLCITIPPRGVKRKLQDVEDDEGFDQPKRILKERWNESQSQ